MFGGLVSVVLLIVIDFSMIIIVVVWCGVVCSSRNVVVNSS